MQIKKEEIRQKIIEIAADEFLKKGYEKSSMRVIAQKANTTQGNIYHYFQNKEVLLETILLPTIEDIEEMMSQHIEREKCKNLSKIHMLKELESLEKHFDESELRCFLDKRVVILLKLESSNLFQRKQKILYMLEEHLREHYNLNDNRHYAEMVLTFLVECLKHVLIEHKDIEEAKKEFICFFKMFCVGAIGQKNMISRKLE